MRVLITGGAGFIGRRLAKALAIRQDEVIVLDTLDPQVHDDPETVSAYLASVGAELRVGSIRDPEAVKSALAEVDAVVHLAALTGVGHLLSYYPGPGASLPLISLGLPLRVTLTAFLPKELISSLL